MIIQFEVKHMHDYLESIVNLLTTIQSATLKLEKDSGQTGYEISGALATTISMMKKLQEDNIELNEK
jgi:hypothetical protein